MTQDRAQLKVTVARFVARLKADGDPYVGPEYVELRRALLSAMQTKSARSFADEVVDTTVDEFSQRVTTSAEVDPNAAQLTKLLFTMLKFHTVDALRREDRVRKIVESGSIGITADDGRGADDAVLALLDASATRDAVYAALSGAFRDRRATTVKVVLAWIKLAEERTSNPSHRDVAAAIGLSHTSVANALDEFRSEYLLPQQEENGD